MSAEYEEYSINGCSVRRTSYAEALEKSWPHGRFLVGLMEGVTKVKFESTDLQSLRLAREKLDSQIEVLLVKRATIQDEINRTCEHPLDRIFVEEFQLDSLKQFKVTCEVCLCELIRHSRNI